jgi:hypothetical protein
MIYKMILPGKLCSSRLEETLNLNVYDNGWGNEQLGNEQLGNEQLGNEQLGMNNWE